MYEELRSTTVHTPITLSEYGQIANRFPDALNWAGGTYLMSRPNFYPMDSNIEIIDLSGIEELQRITRTDRYIEIGSMVTAAQLLDTGRQILPPVLLGALTSIGSTIVRRQITVGGSLCIPDIRLSIPTALAVLDAMAEVRIYLANGKNVTRWIPVSRLYDKDGKFVPFEGKFLLTHIRIGLQYGAYQRFLITGNPMREGNFSVIIAFQAEKTAVALGKVQLCVTFPKKGFFISKEIIGQLSGINLPIAPKTIWTITGNLKGELRKTYPSLSSLQQERALRRFASILYDLNTLYLQS
ncbi:MAG: FAD binding domain-containing protein [Sphaerochaetaceae bacterium]|jgi:CO/xanthine dehydrogenase FAD-binding subunit